MAKQNDTIMPEVYFKQTVDDEEYEVAAIEVDAKWTLMHLGSFLLSEQDFDNEKYKVAFYRNNEPGRKPLPKLTKLPSIISQNSQGNPLNVVIFQPTEKPSGLKRSRSDGLDELHAGTSNERVLEFLLDRAKQNLKQEDFEDPCYPRMVSETWNRDELNISFREKQEIVLRNIREWNDSRAPLVITVVAGYGNGKTHFLKVAPDLVREESLFITYNKEQDLESDKLEPRKALLVRIIFQASGTGSFGAANFLTSPEGKRVLSLWGYDKLLEIAAECLVQKFGGTNSFMICVDEVRKVESINVGATSQLLSTLGALARKVYQSPYKLRCTAIVTALDNEGITVYTSSQRAVATLQLPIPDRSAVEFVANRLNLPPEQVWKIVAVAGSHFRSIVASVEVLNGGNTHVDIERLMRLTYSRLRNVISVDDSIGIKDYTKDMMEAGGPVPRPVSVELICSIDRAVPPTLICTAYRTTLHDLGADKYAMGIFHNDIANSAFHQLELSAMNYDLLRSVWNLHVIPESMRAIDGPGWYNDLKLPSTLVGSPKGILKMEGQKQKTVQWNGLKPDIGVYYHPGLSNHPWIDRFFVAETTDGKQCLVLYQDKINAAGFPHAVNDLNSAATILKDNLQMHILCIANVIDATNVTRKQSDFKHPYLLVRDSELDQFYTPNFAPAMRFLRTRFRDQGTKKIANGNSNGNNNDP